MVMWYYQDKKVNSISDMPIGVYGFVYLVIFEDGKKYIGKKNLYTKHTLKSLKSGKIRDGTLKHIYRNTGKGSREKFDIVQQESNWKEYQGSAVECKNRIAEKKIILQYCYNSFELTYYEAKYLFTMEVLENNHYLNDNILGKFYRSKFSEGGVYNRDYKPTESD